MKYHALFVINMLLMPSSAHSMQHALDWAIVGGISYIKPLVSAKKTLPKNFDPEQALNQTPAYIRRMAYDQCIRQEVDPTTLYVATLPGTSVYVCAIGFDRRGITMQKLITLDSAYFEPPYNCGPVMLAHEVGHIRHHHAQKGILGFIAIPLLVQYIG